MKTVIALLLVILLAIGMVFFKNDEHGSDAPVTGLPWQIDILPDGETRVFGITPGRTTLGEAIALLGDDMELAIIAAPQEPGALEAYYSHFSAGPITGKLILILDPAPDEIALLRERAIKDGGTRRHRLHPDDLPVAYRAPVRVISFMPSFNLDEDIVRTRFGTPTETVRVHTEQQHWLYPEKGLDLILNANGKEVLQYLSPGGFSAHRVRLEQPLQASE